MSDIDLLTLAKEVALSHTGDPKAATDSSAAVGAVILSKDNELVSSANEVPIKVREKLFVPEPGSPERYHFIEHAERAAIFKAYKVGMILEGATMYCTRFPCSDCARAIVESGIGRLVVMSGFDDNKRWVESQRAGRAILKAAEVKIRYLKTAT